MVKFSNNRPNVMKPRSKYVPFGLPGFDVTKRSWVDRPIVEAPLWCSVDLRDGNQALVEPMTKEQKLVMFTELVNIGFSEIEVGFPAASETDYQFVRNIIEQDLIPSNVTIQVLTQCRPELIKRTFEAVQGAKNVIVHFYNSTSVTQRNIVFKASKAEIIKIATDAAALCIEEATWASESNIRFEYSPESFTGTELEFALEISEAVVDVIKPSAERPLIINLPATVETSTPNIYADMIEWMCNNFRDRDSVIVSVHPHNDRGTGVAAAEFGVMAGADRVEGTLFGNGERTGNVDIVTLALNLFTQGVDPELDFSDINRVRKMAEKVTQMMVPPRHPYAGDLVHTAFSGSHQDAIKKGFAAQKQGAWNVPYLPIDPKDIGRTYEDVIRVNSQSGKGGVAYLLEQHHGLILPRRMQIEFSRIVQRTVDATSREIGHQEIWEIFTQTYLNQLGSDMRTLDAYTVTHDSSGTHIAAEMTRYSEPTTKTGHGAGVMEAFLNALNCGIEIESYHEHSVSTGTDSQAACYIEMRSTQTGDVTWGSALHAGTTTASLHAILSALHNLTPQILVGDS